MNSKASNTQWTKSGVFRLICSLLIIKIILGINLITYATRRKIGMDERAAEDEATNNSSIPIGETKDERVSPRAYWSFY
jgi:hypothetical protein